MLNWICKNELMIVEKSNSKILDFTSKVDSMSCAYPMVCEDYVVIYVCSYKKPSEKEVHEKEIINELKSMAREYNLKYKFIDCTKLF